MKKFILIPVVFLIFHTSSYAQFEAGMDKFSIAWEVGIPSNDFLKETSWRGGRIEYQRMLKDNLSVGIAASWNSFSQYVSKTTYQKPDGSGAITTDIVKELYSVPITANVKYYFKSGGKIVPYGGIGLGTQYCDQAIYFNIYGLSDDSWGFVARPELGIAYPVSPTSAISLTVAYNYASNQSDLSDASHLSHIAIGLGFVF